MPAAADDINVKYDRRLLTALRGKGSENLEMCYN